MKASNSFEFVPQNQFAIKMTRKSHQKKSIDLGEYKKA